MSVIRRSVGYAGALEERLIALRVAKELITGGKIQCNALELSFYSSGTQLFRLLGFQGAYINFTI